MSAPSYDWLAQLTLAQQKFLEDNYTSLYSDYKTYGYSVMLYDYARELDEVYDRVKSVHIVEKVALPEHCQDIVREFYLKQLEINQLRSIVVPIQNYHVLFIAEDLRLDSELRKVITDTPVVTRKSVSKDDLLGSANCIVFDDIDMKVYNSVLEECELHAVPYIRRTVAGWHNYVIEKDTENILKSFVERYRPCKVIR